MFAVSAAVLVVVAVVLGQWWQGQLRELMGAAAPSLLLLVLLPLAAVVVFTGLVALSRWLRGVTAGSLGGLGGGWDRGPRVPSAGWRWSW